MPQGGVRLEVDTTEWNALKKKLDGFDKSLSLALRRRIRSAAEEAANAVKDSLREPTPAGTASGPGRDALIAGTRVSVSFGLRSAGAKIVTSGSRLPAAHSALLKVYNLESFRHPIFGERSTWVTQQGRPYFQKPIERSIGENLYREINEALAEAIATIGGRGL